MGGRNRVTVRYPTGGVEPILGLRDPRTDYMQTLVRWSGGHRLLALGLFPDAKEVTESFASYRAIERHVPWVNFQDPDVTLIAVGDGGTPRTAATFAIGSAWACHSVDPALRHASRWESRIARLHVHRRRIEECAPFECDKAVIVAVHSHADLRASIAMVKAHRLAIVSIPCCVRQELDMQPDESYDDIGIWSHQRRVLIWIDIGTGGTV